jgi:hypothetical protein
VEVSNISKTEKKRKSCSKFKAMLIVLAEWVPNSQTINQQCYLEVLTKCENASEGNDQSYGEMVGFCTKTMRQPTMLCL